jgi:hypothetical protein
MEYVPTVNKKKCELDSVVCVRKDILRKFHYPCCFYVYDPKLFGSQNWKIDMFRLKREPQGKSCSNEPVTFWVADFSDNMKPNNCHGFILPCV